MEYLSLWYKHSRETFSDTSKYVRSLDSVKVKASLSHALKTAQEALNNSLTEVAIVTRRATQYLQETFVSITHKN